MRSPKYLLALVLLATLSSLMVGCTSDEPREVVTAYLEAQIDGHGDAAWSLLSRDTQQRISKDQFTSESPGAVELRDKYISELEFEVVDQIVDGDRGEVVVRLRGPDVVEIIRGEEDPSRAEWFRVYHLIREPERGWRIQLASSLPASVLTVSGIFLHRFFDVFERVIGVHERALDIFEKGLDLGDRFLDIFEKELDRAHRQAPPDSDLPDVPPPPEPTPSMDPTGDGDQEPATDVPGLRPPAPSEKRPGREEPTWRHESVEDPMTDRTRQVFWTQGRDVEGAAEDLRLDMWCDDGQARVFIHSNRFHGFESDTFDFGHATARIRLGDEAVRKIRGTLSDNSHSLEFPEGTQLAREMITTDAGELRVEVPTPFDGNLVGRFALNGLDDVIADKREMCLGGAD